VAKYEPWYEKKYKDKERKNDNWFEKAKNIKKVTPITLFIENIIEKRKKGKKNSNSEWNYSDVEKTRYIRKNKI